MARTANFLILVYLAYHLQPIVLAITGLKLQAIALLFYKLGKANAALIPA